MSFRHRRALREFRGYMERLYGPQENLVVEVDLFFRDSIRVGLEVSGVSAPRPEGDGQTHSASSIDRYAPEHVDLVVRLAVRFVAIRSQRYTPGGGLVPEDCHDGEYELHSDYPDVFPVATIEVDVSWQELLRAGVEVLRAEDLLTDLKSSQVKSKFASLRWYFDAKPRDCRDEINAIVNALEYLSTVVCETCGAPGHHRKGGWHMIRCDACQQDVDRQKKRRGG